MNTRRSATCRSSSRSPRTSQRRSPPSTIAATIARSRWVRSAPVSASTSAGVRIRGSVRGRAHQRHALPRPVTAPAGSAARAAPGSRPRPRGPAGTRRAPTRSTAAARTVARRHPAASPASTGCSHRSVAGAAGALGGDERQHVRRGRPRAGGLPTTREEHLQVVRRRQHRVRPAPRRQELQIVIQQRHAQPHHRLPGRASTSGSDTDRRQGISGPPSPDDRRHNGPLEMSTKITRITSRADVLPIPRGYSWIVTVTRPIRRFPSGSSPTGATRPSTPASGVTPAATPSSTCRQVASPCHLQRHRLRAYRPPPVRPGKLDGRRCCIEA